MIGNTFRVVTFDITGTLLKFRHPIGKLYAEGGEMFGIKTDPDILNTNFKKHWVEMNKLHPNYGHCGMGWEEWWKQIVIMTFRDSCGSNPLCNSKTLENVAISLIEKFKTPKVWEHAEGSKEILRNLSNNEVVIGAISNFDVRLYDVLNSMQIYSYFDFVTTSYEAGYMKPHVNIFRRAERMCENITKTNFERMHAIHIGDSYELDFLGAKNAGWNAAVISKPGRICNEIKNLEMHYGSLKELYEYLER